MTDDAKIAETFNSFFSNIVNTLNTEKDEGIFCDTGDETDLLLRAIKRYSKHPSILRIKQYFKNSTEFSFGPIGKDVITKEIKNLNTKKASPQDDIPVKILKLNNDIFSQYLSQFLMEVLKRPISCLYIKSIKALTIYCLDIRWATERDIALNIH